MAEVIEFEHQFDQFKNLTNSLKDAAKSSRERNFSIAYSTQLQIVTMRDIVRKFNRLRDLTIPSDTIPTPFQSYKRRAEAIDHPFYEPDDNNCVHFPIIFPLSQALKLAYNTEIERPPRDYIERFLKLMGSLEIGQRLDSLLELPRVFIEPPQKGNTLPSLWKGN